MLSQNYYKEDGKISTLCEVEEAKKFLRLVPIWAESLVYTNVYAQSSDFFTKQGATLDRTLFIGFQN